MKFIKTALAGNHYRKIANYAWDRAHRSTDPKMRTKWFDIFDVAITFANM